MAEESAQDKTEKPTDRKKEKSRDDGQVAKNKDLSAMAAIGGTMLIFFFSGEYIFSSLASMLSGMLSMKYGMDPMHVSKVATVQGMKIVAPIFLSSIVLVVFANVIQTGFITKGIKFEISKLSPIKGIKKMFSMNSLMELCKSLMKFSAGIWVVYYVLEKNLENLPALAAMEYSSILKVGGDMVMDAVVTAFSYYMVIAIIGYFIDRWQHEKSLKMTKQEIRDENKESEGDPIIKARIRSIQREAARKRMMQEVEKSTVVITNPQHLAVALKYEDNKMHAPKIIAKGAGIIAEKIKAIAKKHGIPVIEEKPIARSLFKLELNTYIPEELYVAVAKIIAYIYKIKGKI